MPQVSSRSTRRTRRVAIIVAEGSNPFEMSVAMEVLGLRRPELSYQPYDVMIFAEHRRTTIRDGLFAMEVESGLDDALTCDTIIVPNRPDPLVGQSPAVLDLVRAAHKRRKRLVGFCTGAFTLASAGVLADRTVTLHWRWVDEFRNRFPQIRIAADSLFVEDRRILTAAGSASALDLCLYLARADHGSEVAASISRRLVLAMHRAGGQRQFVEDPVVHGTSTDHLLSALERISTELATPHTVASMAAEASMAASTFHRHMRERIGVSPLDWLNRQRVSAARRLLETTDHSVEHIARATGLGTAANLRLHFTRELSISPSRYRAIHHTSL
jgi:AraC family transcriptional regulator, transcriptional activator FtrA